MLEDTNNTITEQEKTRVIEEKETIEKVQDDIIQEDFKLIEHLKSTISKRLENFLQHKPIIMEDNHPKVSHKMRVAGKRLRYTLEAFQENNLFSNSIENLKNVQDYLGYMHDLYTHSKYLDKMFKKTKSKKTKNTITEIKVFLNEEYQMKYGELNEVLDVESIESSIKADMDKLDDIFSEKGNIFQNQIYHRYSIKRHNIIKHTKKNVAKKNNIKKGVHKSRVASRRMAEVLKLYPMMYNKKEQKKSKKLLGRIEKKLGNTRELQVLKSFLINYKKTQNQMDKKPINKIVSNIDKKIKNKKGQVIKSAKKMNLDRLDIKPLQ